MFTESTSKDMTTQEMLGWKSKDSSDEDTESQEKQEKKNSGYHINLQL